MYPGLGIDFGGVIADAPQERTLDSSGKSFKSAREVPYALEGVRVMAGLFRGQVWVISKAGRLTEAMTRRWLREHQFERKTGLTPDRVIFVRDRVEKLDRCRDLGITHFVDDQLKNLKLLQGTVEHLFLFGASSAPSPMVAVFDWPGLEQLVRELFVTG